MLTLVELKKRTSVSPWPVGITARPAAGHLVAFKGALQHGGAPVTAGVRYIVAAFLFVE